MGFGCSLGFRVCFGFSELLCGLRVWSEGASILLARVQVTRGLDKGFCCWAIRVSLMGP